MWEAAIKMAYETMKPECKQRGCLQYEFTEYIFIHGRERRNLGDSHTELTSKSVFALKRR